MNEFVSFCPRLALSFDKISYISAKFKQTWLCYRFTLSLHQNKVVRNYENVNCRETMCCQRNREYSGSYDPAERISGREWILCYLDIRTLMYPARTGRIYGEMAKMEFSGIADDPLEIQDPSDRR